MPRDGAVVLSDLRNPTLSIVCEPCGRRGTYNVARLMEQHGDAKLTDLLQTLTDCPKARRPASTIGAKRSGSGCCKRLCEMASSPCRGRGTLEAGQRPAGPPAIDNEAPRPGGGAGQRASVVSPRGRGSRAKGRKQRTRAPTIARRQ